MPAYECRFPWIPAFAGMTDTVDELAFSAYLSGIRVRGAIRFIRETLTGPWLDPQEIDRQLKKPFRLRLV